ncbi:MAG: preprotein translocase subunit SecY [Candidatus Diapherotrites archaeon]
MGFLEWFEPIYRLLPEVKSPEVKPTLKKRLMWTALALVIFYIMGNIQVIGITASSAGQLEQLQVILASEIGTLITVGIGPIVLASIILQLLIGGGLIDADLTDPKTKARFTSMQKLMAIVLCFFESAIYVLSGFIAPDPGMLLFVVLQISLGAILLIYLDEVVSKYGIGSGIGLFIAANVAGSVFWRVFAPPIALQGQLAGGILSQFIDSVASGSINLIILLPLLFTLIVFVVVTFAEGMHVNIPLTMGPRGVGGRFPVKFLYVSNIPVILAAALFANLRLWAEFTKTVPVLGYVLNGVATIVVAPYGLIEKMLLQGVSFDVFGQMLDSILKLQIIGLGGEIIHAILYIIILTVLCVVFGKFWVDMGGQGTEAVSNQLQKAGMSIPGFRKDPRIIRKVLERYIPPVTVLGSIFVGLLAGFADLTGALGSGTGILLTVGIVYRLYEDLAKEQVAEMYPMLGRFFT